MANAQTIAAPADRLAAGVVYFEVEGAPGLKMFRCDRLSCTLSVKGCAGRWSKAEGNDAPPARGDRRHRAAPPAANDGILSCRGCSIGAAHAGVQHVEYSQHFGASICPRCRRGTTRMIQGRVCVSCRNREYELEKGANARGNVPVELIEKRPHVVEFRVIEGGRARAVRAANVVDLFEPVFQTLRTTKGAVAFGFQGPTGLLRQGRLF